MKAGSMNYLGIWVSFETLSRLNLQQITFIQVEEGIVIGQHVVKRNEIENCSYSLKTKMEEKIHEWVLVGLKKKKTNHQMASFGRKLIYAIVSGKFSVCSISRIIRW